MVSAGAFAAVYQVTVSGRKYAVRCFTREVKDQQARYNQLSDYLINVLPPSLVYFEYIERGISVKGEWYPIIKMDWVEGEPLSKFVGSKVDEPGAIHRLAAHWRGGPVPNLRGLEIAHNDLQHGNVMVESDGSVRLVDYDGMFLPQFKGERSPELGHKNYQHPARTSDHYDENIDNFSSLVIYISLLAIASDPSLWSFHNEDNLIFTRSDYDDPQQSELFLRLKQASDPAVAEMAKRLEEYCQLPVGQVPNLVTALRDLPDIVPPTPPPILDKPGTTSPPVGPAGGHAPDCECVICQKNPPGGATTPVSTPATLTGRSASWTRPSKGLIGISAAVMAVVVLAVIGVIGSEGDDQTPTATLVPVTTPVPVTPTPSVRNTPTPAPAQATPTALPAAVKVAPTPTIPPKPPPIEGKDGAIYDHKWDPDERQWALYLFAPAPTATPTRTPYPTRTPTPVPTATPTHTPTATPIPTPLPTRTPTPVPTNTSTPTAAPTSTPSPTSTPTPSSTPVPPTATPTPTPLPSGELKASASALNVGELIRVDVGQLRSVTKYYLKTTGHVGLGSCGTSTSTEFLQPMTVIIKGCLPGEAEVALMDSSTHDLLAIVQLTVQAPTPTPTATPTPAPLPVIEITTKGREVEGGEQLTLRAKGENFVSVHWIGGHFSDPESLNTLWYVPAAQDTSQTIEITLTATNSADDEDKDTVVFVVRALPRLPTAVPTPEPHTLPIAAPVLELISGGDVLTITWDHPCRNCGEFITWELEVRKTTDGAGHVVVIPIETSHELHLMNAEPGTTYEVRVRARYTTGVSDWSPEGRLTVPEAPPSPTPTSQ